MAAQRPGRRRIVVAVAALLVVLLAGGGAAASRSGLLARAADHLPWASSQPQQCATTDVGVVVADEIAPVVLQVLNPLTGHALPDGTCLRVDVQAQDPAKTSANAAVTATADLPQVWVPDSSLWLGLTAAWPVHPVGSLGTSPVVLATSHRSLGRLGWVGRPVTWPQGLSNTHAVVAPSVTDDAAALLSLLAMTRTLGSGPTTQQRVAATVLAASAQPARDISSAFDLVRADGRTAPVFLTSEHRVRDADKEGPGLVAVHPVGPPVQLDFPIVRLSRPSDDPIVTAGADLVVKALTSPAAQRAAASAGFGPPSPAVVPQSDAARAAQQATAAKVAAFVTELRTLALPTRMLVVVDVSLSMAEPAQPGISRIRLAAGAALGVGPLLPGGSAVGLWAFAGRQRDGTTYRELAKLDFLASPDHLVPGDHDHTHRDVVERGLRSLPGLLSPGGTALYDTALAALRDAHDQYDQQANNSVVLFTDGANDYDRGITLRQFQAAARQDAQAHPDQLVRLITIGIGPQADMPALNAMCEAAQGRAYRADTIESLRQVLFDAIAHRPVVQSR